MERPLLDRLSDNNVDLRSFLEMERDEFRPHFVKVIDWSEWNRDSPTKRTEDSNDNEKVVILFQRSLEWDGVQRIVFYKADIDSEIPSVTDPIKTIFINYGCTGVQLSADHRLIGFLGFFLKFDSHTLSHMSSRIYFRAFRAIFCGRASCRHVTSREGGHTVTVTYTCICNIDLS